MNKIEKKQSFFRDNLPYIMGGFYILVGFISYLLESSMPYIPYTIFGIAAIIFGVITKNSRKEYIKWDAKSIIIKDNINGKLTYSWEHIDDIIFSKDHVTLKSGKANGIMLELREYKTRDINFLKEQFTSFSYKMVDA